MKNRLHDKKAGIFILVSLIIISVAEVIFRAVALGERNFFTPNLGEQLVVIGLALAILIFTITGKDRLCYICTGAWIAYFILDQLFEIPGVLSYVILFSKDQFIYFLSPALHLVSMICTFVLGILLIEYMNDGTIYNRAFNTFCAITIITTLGSIFVNIYNVAHKLPLEIVLAIFNNLYCIAMLLFFVFFAYDSAKKQLLKVDFSK